jgi:hypothetical protein
MTESRFRPVARIFQNRRPLVLGSCRSGANCSTTAMAAAVGDENSRPPHGAVRMRNVIVCGSKVPSTRLRLYTLKTSISPSDLPSVAGGPNAASALGVFAMRSSTSDRTSSATDDCDRLAAMASLSNVCWSTVCRQHCPSQGSGTDQAGWGGCAALTTRPLPSRSGPSRSRQRPIGAFSILLIFNACQIYDAVCMRRVQ